MAGRRHHQELAEQCIRQAQEVEAPETKIVAVVDDDPSVRNALVRLLAAYGFQSTAYESAEAFWECHDARHASCVVLDINMPGMSGIELRHRLRKRDSGQPVIFMTANDHESTRIAAKAAGCVAYLRKPFPAEMLIAAIKKAAA
jgi:FixJ family two-component response regulator